jgi:hypothetical protein
MLQKTERQHHSVTFQNTDPVQEKKGDLIPFAGPVNGKGARDEHIRSGEDEKKGPAALIGRLGQHMQRHRRRDRSRRSKSTRTAQRTRLIVSITYGEHIPPSIFGRLIASTVIAPQEGLGHILLDIYIGHGNTKTCTTGGDIGFTFTNVNMAGFLGLVSRKWAWEF